MAKPPVESAEKEKKTVTDQEKLELHRAKRRAQAAKRRERARKEKEEAEARAKQEEEKKKAAQSRATSADEELAMLVDDGLGIVDSASLHWTSTTEATGEGPPYGAGTTNDNSEYNTEYEDVGGDGDHDRGGDSEMGIDEELAQLS